MTPGQAVELGLTLIRTRTSRVIPSIGVMLLVIHIVLLIGISILMLGGRATIVLVPIWAVVVVLVVVATIVVCLRAVLIWMLVLRTTRRLVVVRGTTLLARRARMVVARMLVVWGITLRTLCFVLVCFGGRCRGRHLLSGSLPELGENDQRRIS